MEGPTPWHTTTSASLLPVHPLLSLFFPIPCQEQVRPSPGPGHSSSEPPVAVWSSLGTSRYSFQNAHEAGIVTAVSVLCLKLTELSNLGVLWGINCFPVRPLWGVPLKIKVHVNRHVTTDLQMADKHMKRWPTSLAVGGVQAKITVTYYYIPVRMAKIKK